MNGPSCNWPIGIFGSQAEPLLVQDNNLALSRVDGLDFMVGLVRRNG